MFSKIILLVSVFAIVTALPYQVREPSESNELGFFFKRLIPKESPAKAHITKAIFPETVDYKYKYNVNDPISGDVKSHRESRKGDYVEGSYSFMDADGTLRVVDYTVDKLKGFNAVVRKIKKEF